MTDLNAITSTKTMNLLICVYDICGYMQFARTHSSEEVFHVMNEFYKLSTAHIAKNHGLVIKFIGDSGLCIFPPELASDAIVSMREFKRICDKWMSVNMSGATLAVNCHVGPVTIGPTIGYAGKSQLDVMGEAVNICFTMGKKDFILSPQAFRSLRPEARKQFKKYTPPITYRLAG